MLRTISIGVESEKQAHIRSEGLAEDKYLFSAQVLDEVYWTSHSFIPLPIYILLNTYCHGQSPLTIPGQ